MKQTYLTLNIISNETNISITALYISNVATSLGINERKSRFLCFVVEAVLDMRISQIGKKNPFIEIEVLKEFDDIVISIKDKGLPYVLSENQRRILSNGFVYRYELSQLGSEGQRLSFYLKPDLDDSYKLPEIISEELLDNNFTFLKTDETDEQINEAIKCIYSTYGYDYIHESIYKIDYFRSLLQEKTFISTLAKNEHNQYLGHVGLTENKYFPGLFELGNLVTKPFARGNSIANRLTNYILKCADDFSTIQGCFAECVLFHRGSQRISNECGFTPLGFVFHALPPHMAEEVYRDGNRRLDFALNISMKNHDKLHNLYLPNDVKDYVLNIFEKENVKYELSSDINESVNSKINTSINNYTKASTIIIDESSNDIEMKIKDILNGSEVKDSEVVYCYLNINHFGCINCYNVLRSLGFIFTGLFPGSNRGDYLLLEHLLDKPLEYNKLLLEPNFELLLQDILKINKII